MSNVVDCTGQQSANKDAKGVSRVAQKSRFFTLPAKVRTMIYDYHFALPRPVQPRKLGSGCAFYRNHVWNCPLNDHRLDWDPSPGSSVRRAHAICQSPFAPTYDIPIPPSVLGLLLVCHHITEEAKGRFYKVNHFVFDKSKFKSHLKHFITEIGERYLSLEELSFRFSSLWADEVFGLLSKSTNLKVLHIVIDPEASDVLIKSGRPYYQFLGVDRMQGMDALLKIRGLKTLEISVQSPPWPPWSQASISGIETMLRSKLLLPHTHVPVSPGPRKRRAKAANATNAPSDANDTTTQA